MYAPKGVKNYMGDDAQPIVETTNEWIALNDNLDHPILPTRRSKTGFQVLCNFFKVRATSILINKGECGGCSATLKTCSATGRSGTGAAVSR